MSVDGTGDDDADVGEAWVPATSGECPICGSVFDDATRFSEHLAEVHELFDEEGVETSFGLVPVAPADPTSDAPRSPLAPTPLASSPDERAAHLRDDEPVRGRPTGLLLLTLSSILVLIGMIVFLGPDDDPATDTNDAAADVETDDSTRATGSSTSESRRTTTTKRSAPDGGSGVPATTAPGATSATAGSSSSTSLATTTTAASPSYVSPTTSGASVDGCERVKNRDRVTFSWRFVGGSGWRAPPSYTALGNGRYRTFVDVSRNRSTAITTVHVLDPKGIVHDVSLVPALSSASC